MNKRVRGSSKRKRIEAMSGKRSRPVSGGWLKSLAGGILLLFFLSAPLLVIPGYIDGEIFCTLYDLPKYVFIIVAGLLLTALFFFHFCNFSGVDLHDFRGRHLSVAIFLLLLVWMTFSVFSASVPVLAVVSLVQYVILGLLGFLVWRRFFLNLRWRWLALYGLLAGLALFTFIGLLQAAGLHLPFILPIRGPASTLGYRNPAAHFISLVLPFVVFAGWRQGRLWQERRKTMHLVFTVVLGLVFCGALMLLVLNYSRAGIMALAAEAVLLPLFWLVTRNSPRSGGRGRIKSLFQACAAGGTALLLVIALVMVVPASRQRVVKSWRNFSHGGMPRLLETRYYHWGNTLMMIRDNPFTGVGLGHWRITYPLYYKSFARDPLFNYRMQVRKTHNDYLQLAAECGIPALLLFLLLWGRQFYLLRYREESEDGMDWRLPLAASLLAYSVIMMVSFPLQMAFSRMLIFFLIALNEARAWPALLK
jgi:O-antigen ligase